MATHREEIAAEVRALHARIDAAVAPLVLAHGPRLRCRAGCASCCCDELTVLQVEADRIQHEHAALLAEGVPAPAGACAFLATDGACRIYAARPYVCRTQGLPLRWLNETPEGALEELRDICPVNLPGPPLESLPSARTWLIGPAEDALMTLQERRYGALTRLPLRALFRRV